MYKSMNKLSQACLRNVNGNTCGKCVGFHIRRVTGRNQMTRFFHKQGQYQFLTLLFVYRLKCKLVNTMWYDDFAPLSNNYEEAFFSKQMYP